ncbi:umecyanin-like [Typha latifolia]|uniref:umecyanin-like n=1 Tax=Typha latifolia TaxID=4733 RepID=UPI003C2D8555
MGEMTPLRALFAAILMAAIFELAVGANYTVGAPNGSWNLQTDLKTWASSIKFQPGDFLIFSYASSAHDVVEVTASNYAACRNTNPIFSDMSGRTIIALTTTNSRYFICGVGNHCVNGMKVQIDVVAATPDSPASPPPAASSPPPSSSSPPDTLPSPPSSPSPPASSPPPSGWAEVNKLGMAAKVAVGILLMLVAF